MPHAPTGVNLTTEKKKRRGENLTTYEGHVVAAELVSVDCR